MVKRIVVCFDGTWNTPDNSADLDGGVETNVCRLYRSVRTKRTTRPQIKWYDEGVGTEWFNRLKGGAFGLGLSRNIRQGYKFLADHHEDGDEVFVFGFSRGAYTARSLIGLIRNCGLLRKGDLPHPNADDNPILMEAYALYRARDDGADSAAALAFRAEYGTRIIPIKFLGVWDTVGALGIPIGSFAAFNKRQFEFHDTELSGIVENAYHAVALDEHREPYEVTLWDPKEKPNQVMEQRWFVGAHADVGGGYPDRALSDITLRWMQMNAQACGLELDPTMIPEIADASCLGPVTDSYRDFLKGTFSLFNERYYRKVRRTQFGQEIPDETIANRKSRDATYKPRNMGL